MKFRSFNTGPGTNAYLVYDEDSKDAIVIDSPPEFAAQLFAAVKEEDVNVTQVVLTHGHWDHLVDIDEVSDTLGADRGAPGSNAAA